MYSTTKLTISSTDVVGRVKYKILNGIKNNCGTCSKPAEYSKRYVYVFTTSFDRHQDVFDPYTRENDGYIIIRVRNQKRCTKIKTTIIVPRI